MADQDFYKILGVSKNADTDEIKGAFRDLALKYHPDRNEGNPDAVDKMKALNEAYAVLSDPVKRKDYDRLQQQYGSSHGYTQFRKAYSEQDIFSGADIQKIFEEMARSFGLRNFEEISREFYGKKNNSFEFKSGNVHFKGFFFSGTFQPGKSMPKLNLSNVLGRTARTFLQNFSGRQLTGSPGNLNDTIQIDPELARKGGPYAYYHKWQDKKLVIKIPAGIKNGQKIRLQGMGKRFQGSSGDLFIRVETKTSFLDSIRKFFPV